MHDLPSVQTSHQLDGWAYSIEADDDSNNVTLKLYSPERTSEGVARTTVRYELQQNAIIVIALQLLDEIERRKLSQHEKDRLRTSADVLTA